MEQDHPNQWRITIATAVISLISAITVAAMGLIGGAHIATLETEVKSREVALEQKKFDAEQRGRKDTVLTTYIPQIINGDPQESDAAVSILALLYPNEMIDMLTYIGEVIQTDKKEWFAETIRRAATLQETVGFWIVVIGRNSTLQGAKELATRAERQGYSPVRIFRHGAAYSTAIGRFNSQLGAERESIAIQSKTGEATSIFNLNMWCEAVQINADYLECAVRGTTAAPYTMGPTIESNKSSGPRPTTTGIIIHSTLGGASTPEAELAAVRKVYETGDLRVSVHRVIGIDGTIYKAIDDDLIAWHAGRFNAEWLGLQLVQQKPENEFTDAQYRAAAALTREWAAKYGFPVDRGHIRGHNEFDNSSRDPTGLWSWDRFMEYASAS